MVEETIKEVKNHFLERVANPLFGSFLIATSMQHWKIFQILFKTNSVTVKGVTTTYNADEKILDIHNYFDSLAWYQIWLYPLLYAILIVVVWQILSLLGKLIYYFFNTVGFNYFKTELFGLQKYIPATQYTLLDKSYKSLSQEYDNLKEENLKLVSTNYSHVFNIDNLEKEKLLFYNTQRLDDIRLTTNENLGQKTAYEEIDLQGKLFYSITSNLKVTDNFMRFGFKLGKRESEAIKNDDNNTGSPQTPNSYLFHIAKTKENEDYEAVCFLNDSLQSIASFTKLEIGDEIRLELRIMKNQEDGYNLHFVLNGTTKIKCKLDLEYRFKLFVLMWGDQKTNSLEVTNINLQTVS